MAEPLSPRLRLPAAARRGEVIEIKTLVQHPMESGQRRDGAALVPRRIVNRFTCRFNGRLVLDARLEPAISANPYFAFHFRASESGSFEFVWIDDDGAETRQAQSLTVG